MCDAAANTCPFAFDSVPDQFKTQKMCDKVISKKPFMLKFCPDKYKTQEMCDIAVDFYLITLKFVLDWFVTNKILEKLDNSVFSTDDTFFHDVDSTIVTFLNNDMFFNTIDFDNINLDDDDDDDSFNEDDPETINHIKLKTWHNRFK